MRTLEELLQSTSDVLFPEDLGEKEVRLDSRGSDGDTPLHVLLWQKDIEGSRALISAGADPNAIGDMGETPLHVAVHQDLSEIVELLLRAGSDPNVRSELGSTPRELALTRAGATASAFGRGGT